MKKPGIAKIVTGIASGVISCLIGYSSTQIVAVLKPEIAKQSAISAKEEAPKSLSSADNFVRDLVTAKDKGLDFEIVSIVERIPGDDLEMLEKITIKCNTPDCAAREILIDEVEHKNYVRRARNPANDFANEAGLCLMSQIHGGEQALGILLEDLRINRKISYIRKDGPTKDNVGYTETVETRINIRSEDSKEAIKQIAKISLESCFGDKRLENERLVPPTLLINGTNVEW